MCKTTILHAKNCYTNILLCSICPKLISKLLCYTGQIIPWTPRFLWVEACVASPRHYCALLKCSQIECLPTGDYSFIHLYFNYELVVNFGNLLDNKYNYCSNSTFNSLPIDLYNKMWHYWTLFWSISSSAASVYRYLCCKPVLIVRGPGAEPGKWSKVFFSMFSCYISIVLSYETVWWHSHSIEHF